MDTRTPVLLFSSERHDGYTSTPLLVLKFRPAYLTPRTSCAITWAAASSTPTASSSPTSRSAREPNAGEDRSYGWSVEYREVFSGDLRRAETMVKTLRRVTRGLETMQSKLGYADSFGAYVARVANVLGIDTYGWRIDARKSGLYAEHTYHWTDVAGMTSHVSRAVYAFRREHQTTAA